MLDKLKQLMEVKKQAENLRRELESTHMEITDVRGIKIGINGAQRFQTIEIDSALLGAENKKQLEVELLRSLNIAIGKSQAAATQKMQAMTGLNIPGL